MSNKKSENLVMHWFTIVAIAAIAISLTVGFHEGIHALSCRVVGGDLKAYTALYVDCDYEYLYQEKFVTGSASVANILLGLIVLAWLRRSRFHTPEFQFFLWLLALMNFLYGAGYWIISGIANFGDWAIVIHGLNPPWAYRSGMTLLGLSAFMCFVWLALKELGRIIGGTEPELYRRTRQLIIPSYCTALFIIALAGIFSTHGITGTPAIGGIIAALGALSPLLWMTEWFHAKIFIKDATCKPLTISRRWGYISASGIIVFIYVVVLG